MDNNLFTTLNAINVNGKTEEKNGLTYLSWAWAWAEFKKVCPDATYTIYKNEQGLPYVFDENTGYMVYTTVTAAGITHEMWLPVMDAANHAMKAVPYEITTKYGKKIPVEAATMFDINKSVMRCLTKNISMFGLGLYIYAGEDLPSECPTNAETDQAAKNTPKRGKAENGGKTSATTPDEVKCEMCGLPIVPFVTQVGNTIGVAELVSRSKKKFNKTLCPDCATSMLALTK